MAQSRNPLKQLPPITLLLQIRSNCLGSQRSKSTNFNSGFTIREAMAESIGHTTLNAIWDALEAAYNHVSIERMHTPRDSLRTIKKGTSTVAEYAKKFKGICDQLSAIGHSLDETDKHHWFLCGLGSSFETFSTPQRLIRPKPTYRDLVSQAGSHELFLQSLNDSIVAPVAFIADNTNNSYVSKGRGNGRSFRGSSSRGRGRNYRRSPHCQLCRKDGHYASSCPDLQTFAQRPQQLDANFAQAFTTQCTTTEPDWFVDLCVVTYDTIAISFGFGYYLYRTVVQRRH